MSNDQKPLGGRAYGSIPHLAGSRRGPSDRGVNDGQHAICCLEKREKKYRIIVQEKLDGSCVSVARIDGELHALIRAGYFARTSPFEQHHVFHRWVEKNRSRFMALLRDGERVVGEWLAQAHGTRYHLQPESDPFVPFDIMIGSNRSPVDLVASRCSQVDLKIPAIVHDDTAPLDIPTALERLGTRGRHGAIEPIEGAVWRVEKKDRVLFLAKYVRPEKVDGCYLPEISGLPRPIWNWHPELLMEAA